LPHSVYGKREVFKALQAIKLDLCVQLGFGGDKAVKIDNMTRRPVQCPLASIPVQHSFVRFLWFVRWKCSIRDNKRNTACEVMIICIHLHAVVWTKVYSSKLLDTTTA